MTITLEDPANGTIGGTNDNSLLFNVVFDSDLNGSSFTAADITVNSTNTIASTTKTVSGVSPNYTVTIGGVTGDGTLGITLDAAGIEDNAKNTLSTVGSAQVSSLFTVDNTQPEVVLTRNTVTNGTFSGSNDDAVSFDVAFTEPIVDGSLTVDDIIVLASGVSSGTPTIDRSAGDNQNYTINIPTVTGDGTIAVRLSIGSTEDPSGNTLLANVTSSAITIDNTLPTVSITRQTVTNGTFGSTNDDLVKFDIAFSSKIDVATFDLTDITVNDASGAVLYTALGAGDLVNNNSSDSINYTLTISSILGDGDLSITIANASVKDLAGNDLNGAVTSNTFSIDNTLPIVTITLEDPANGTIGGTNDNSLIFNLTFNSDLNGSSFTAGDVTVNTSGTASTTKTVSGVSPNYTVTIGGVTGDGTLGITLTETGIQDNAVNNLSTAGNAHISSLFTLDKTKPTVTLTRNAVTNGTFSGSNDDAISFDVAFSEPIVDASFTVDDIIVLASGASVGTATITNDGDNQNYTIDIPSITGDGTVAIRLSIGATQDPSGNTLASSVTSGAITIDNTLPTVTFSDSLASVTNGDPFIVIATFSEAVTKPQTSSFSITEGVIINVDSASSTKYRLNVDPTNGRTNAVTIKLDTAEVTDNAGNKNIASSTYSISFDDQAPTFSILSTQVIGRTGTLSVSLNELGNVYYAVVADGDAAPTSAQIKSGTVASFVYLDTLDVTAIGTTFIQEFTLDADRANYDVYLVTEDLVDGLNLQTTPTKLDITSGGVVITAPSLADICLEGEYFSLGDIVIEETISTDFVRSSSNKSILLELPANFEFNNTVGSASGNGGDLSVSGSGITYNTSKTAATISFAIPTNTNLDQLTISGLQVRALGSSISTNVAIRRGGGSADVYLGNESDNQTFATLTTIPPFDAPDIVTSASGSETNPYILEISNGTIGDVLGDAITVYALDSVNSSRTPMNIGALTQGNTVRIYTDQALVNEILSFSDSVNYLPTFSELGLDATSVGINSFWITVTDGKTCESAATKYSVAIIRLENSASSTSFTTNDQTGTNFKLSYPISHTAIFTGKGLTNFEANDIFTVAPNDNAYSVQFIPAAAGIGRDTIKYALSKDGTTANYWIPILVNSTTDVFADATPLADNGLCEEDGNVIFEVVNAGNVDYLGGTDGADPDFHAIRIFDYVNETRGSNLTTTLIGSNPDTSNVSTPTAIDGWSINTAGASVLFGTDYSKDVLVAMIIADEITGTLTELSSEVLTIYRTPDVSITNLNEYYCADDGDVNIRVQIVSADGTTNRNANDTGYSLYYFDGTDYDSLVRTFTGVIVDSAETAAISDVLKLTDLDQNGSDYTVQDESGKYRVIYNSSSAYSSAACSSSAYFDFELLGKPDKPELTNDLTNVGGLFDLSTTGDGIIDDYLLEYSQGSVLPTITASTVDADTIIWYSDVFGTATLASQGIKGSEITPATLFGTATPNAAVLTFYFSRKTSVDINGSGFDGCESELRTVRIIIRANPIVPSVDEELIASDSTNKPNLGLFNISENRVATTGYSYEYCGASGTNVQLLDIVIDNELETTESAESYYTIYDNDASTVITTIMDTVLSATVSSTIEEILNYDAVATAVTGSKRTFYISRTDFDNIPADGATLNQGSEFNGCESELRKFTIDVYPIPDVPVDANFKGGENISNRQYSQASNEMQYYMCSGDNLEFGQLESPGLTGSAYTWYKDDGTGTAPKTGTDAVMQAAAFNGRLITLAELETAGVFTPEVSATTTFVYWVTQTKNVNASTGFLGCESEPIKVNLTLFPDPSALTFDETSSQSLVTSYCVGDLDGVNFPITGNPNSTFRYYKTNSDGTTLESAATTLFAGGLVGSGKEAPTTTALLTPNAQGTYYYLISQTNDISPSTNIADPNLTDFAGCESEIADMAFLTINVYDIPNRPVVSGTTAATVYFCEDDVTNNGITVDGEGNAGESIRWYEDNDGDQVPDGAFIFEGVAPTASDLNLRNVPGDGIYRFLVTQAQDINAGIAGFEGCESDALEIVILEMPPMPVTIDPAPTCNDDVAANPIAITYNGVRPSIGTTRFNWYENDTIQSTFFTTTPASPDLSNSYTRDWTQFDLKDGLIDTIFVSQEVSIGGITCESERAPVRVEIHPYPEFHPIANQGNAELRILKACDQQEVQLEVVLSNLKVNDATLTLFGARSNPYPLSPILTAGDPIFVNDSTVRFVFQPELENLEAARVDNKIEAGNNTFVVEIIDNNDPTNGQSCVTLATRTLEIGTNPIPEVRWEGLTAGKTTDFIFRDQNTSTSVNYRVDSVYLIIDELGINQPLGRSLRKTGVFRQDTISMSFADPGTYLVEAYFVSSSQCVASETRYITILETVEVVDNSTVIHTFENGSHGWVVDSTAVNGWDVQPAIWQLGPEVANYGTEVLGVNGSNHWGTLLDGISYKANNNLLEAQYIYSPAFNTLPLELPTISFLHAHELNAKDGVVLQQSVDDGRTWTLVGNYNDQTDASSGKNWYNRRDLASSPGNSNLPNIIGENENPGSNGWTVKSEGWVISAHKIDRLESVRFRFAIGSLVGDNTGLAGFGFDDFKLYSREKKILIEQFSSINSGPAEFANDSINEMLASGLSNDAIWINYYTDLAGTDPLINDRNNSDPGARLSYYGVSDVGTTVLSGSEEFKLKGNDPGWSVDQFNSISLDTAGFKITSLSIGGESTELEITASFESNISLPAKSEVSFRFAVVEREKVNDGKTYYNVLRKMLPSSAGYTFVSDGSAKSLFRGRTAFFGPNADQNSITINWDLPTDVNVDSLRVIAFVQVDNSEQAGLNGLILQADYADVVPGSKEAIQIVGIVKNKILDNKDFAIYPNPANKMFQLQLAKPASSDMNWVIYDQTGKKVKTGSLHMREMEIEINTIDLSSGVYLIQVFNEEEQWKPKRLMIRR